MLPGPPDSVRCSNLAGRLRRVLRSQKRDVRCFGRSGVSCRAGKRLRSVRADACPGKADVTRKDEPQRLETGNGGVHQQRLRGIPFSPQAPRSRPRRACEHDPQSVSRHALMLTDGDSITPGPWTYHSSGSRCSSHAQGARCVRLPCLRPRSHTRLPSRQERSGYFRSQKGEWDSNGQALWTAWQHAILSHDTSFVPDLIGSLGRGPLDFTEAA